VTYIGYICLSLSFFPSLTSAPKPLYGQRVFVSPGRTQYTFCETHAYGRTVLNERSASRRDLYLTTRNTHNLARWALVPKFAGSNPAEAVGFFRAKKSSARLPSERK
jgi:hypothetical protein